MEYSRQARKRYGLAVCEIVRKEVREEMTEFGKLSLSRC
jgi:hypothetical protein